MKRREFLGLAVAAVGGIYLLSNLKDPANLINPPIVDSVSQNGLELIKSFEGLRLRAYLPTEGDVWTIGYGHTRNVTQGMIITVEEANRLLLEDIQWVEAAIGRNVTVSLTQNQFDALASWIFNLGETNLRRSTLLRKLNTGDYEGAGLEFLKWVRQDGGILQGLVTRRTLEHDLWRT